MVSVTLMAAALALAGCTEREPLSADAGGAEAGVAPDLTAPAPDGPVVDLRICGPGTTLCSGQCVNTQRDHQNCGQCGQACKAGQVCSLGKCTTSCQSGLTDCSGACVNLQTDLKNCGKCAAACNAGQVCSLGKCQLSCQPGLTDCSGACVNLQTDLSNCGACATACKAGEVCSTGNCAVSCQTGLTNCSGACVNLQTDLSNCGACATACKAGEVCSAGKCALSCQSGLTDCSGTCVNLQTDLSNCGACAATCKAGESCKAGKCLLTCQAGLTDCSGTCINLQTDVLNCGGCGTKCGAGKWCCAGVCRDVLVDPANCGACGFSCKAGEACTGGACGCAGSSKTAPGASCQAIKKAGCSSGDGVYWLDPDGGSATNAFQAYCRMTAKDGPWTLVMLNSAHKTPPKPKWVAAITGSTVTGNINNGLNAFDQLVGLKYWTLLGNTLRLEVGVGPNTVTQHATYLFNLDSSKFYALKLWAQQLQPTTASAPGLFAYHNGLPFSTVDADHDSYGGNCSLAYGSTAWWYKQCWSGSLWGGGGAASHKNRPYWAGSVVDSHPWGAMWITSRTLPRSCKEALQAGVTTSGPQVIDPTGGSVADAFEVYCDMTTDGGGWTQIEYLTTDTEGYKAAYASVFSSLALGTAGKGSYKVPATGLLALSSELRYSEPATAITDGRVSSWAHDVKCGITADVRAKIAAPGYQNQKPAKVTCTNLKSKKVSASAVLFNYMGWSGCWTGPRLWVGKVATAPQYHGDYCVDCVATWKCGATTKGIYSTVSAAGSSFGSGAFWLR